jgi:threonine dehydrogenase-like Zn-dependent dehydrogenase
MRATVIFGAGDVRIEDVPDARLVEPTDAVVRVTRACICGSDLWPYASLEPTETGQRIGHEAIGIVEDVGADVRTVKPGDLVVMPFAFSDGTRAFLECVGLEQSTATAIRIARPGGAVGRVGVPQDATMPASQPAFFANVTVGGGPAPARAYIEELLPDILEGRIEPGRVFDRTVRLDGVPDGYRAMNDRESIKVMVTP